MDETNTPRVVRNIHCEPELFDGSRRISRQTNTRFGEIQDDLVDDALAEDNHPEPAETGHVAYLVFLDVGGPEHGVMLAKVTVALVAEDARGFVSLCLGITDDESCEARIHKVMEFSTGGIEVDEGVDGEVFGNFEHELRVIEKAAEDAEFGRGDVWSVSRVGVMPG